MFGCSKVSYGRPFFERKRLWSREVMTISH